MNQRKRKKSGRKLLSFLLMLSMVVGLLPWVSLTAHAAVSNISISDVALYDDNSLKNFTVNFSWQGGAGPIAFALLDNEIQLPSGSGGFYNYFAVEESRRKSSYDDSLKYIKEYFVCNRILGFGEGFNVYSTTQSPNGLPQDPITLELSEGDLPIQDGKMYLYEWRYNGSWKCYYPDSLVATFEFKDNGFTYKSASSGSSENTVEYKKYNVTVTSGSNMTIATNSGVESQEVVSSKAMTDVVYTANDGYYFPEDYSVAPVNGISVTRNSNTQITVSGTPTADAAITLTDPTATTPETNIPSFKAHSVVLGGQIGVNFYMELPQIEGYDYNSDNSCYMEFTLNGNKTQMAFTNAPVDSKTGYRKFTCYLNSLQMADEITAVFHYNNTQTEANTYSVKTYVDYITNHADQYDSKAVALVKSIANYGHYTQPFIASESSWTDGYDHQIMPAAFEITDEHISAACADLNGKAIVKELDGSGLSEVQYSLSFGSETNINLYVKPEEGVDITKVTCVDAKGADKPVTSSTSGKYSINKINALDLGKQYTFTIRTSQGTATVKVYPLSYAHAFLNADSSSKQAKQAMTALYQYYKATDDYVNGN